MSTEFTPVTSLEAPDQPIEAAEAAPGRRRRIAGVGSIQSKLLVMLLLSSILASSVVGLFAYRTGTDALRTQAYERLSELRDERAHSLQTYFARTRGTVIINSKGVTVEAMTDFDAAYDELRRGTVQPAQTAVVTDWYDRIFVPQLQANSDGTIQPDSFVPTSPARTYLQAIYTATADTFDEGLAIDDPGDGSAWSAANAKYQPFFREVVKGTGADDIMLVNPDGDIVYTAYKAADLGSNVKRGEYRGGGLEAAFDAALRSNSADFTTLTDLELYQPSYGNATAFAASPVVDASDSVIGVFVAQIPIEGINAVMTGSREGSSVTGLGRTGETLAVGPDHIMRSNARKLIEDPPAFSDLVTSAGTPQVSAERQVATGSSVMRQEVKSALATRGDQVGSTITTDYLGHEVLAVYGPADIEGLDWTVVAKMDTDEAFAPLRQFARSILVATAAIVLLISAASVLMARVFTAPLNRLLTGVRAVAGGDLGSRVDAGSRDEFGDLGVAFNDMSASLAIKQSLLEGQQEENERMVRAQMPDTVAKRYRGGETDIASEHQNVSVVYTEIEGFDEFAAKKPTGESLALLNTLSRGFDEAVRKTGVDRVRSMGTGYVASSGLVSQRVDHARRVVDFALEMAQVVERFNAQNGARLVIRAGVHSGSVRSGLVGRTDVVYNLWGEAVDLAYRVRTVAGSPGIYLTDSVKERLGGAYEFEEAGQVALGSGTSTVWRVIPTETS